MNLRFARPLIFVNNPFLLPPFQATIARFQTLLTEGRAGAPGQDQGIFVDINKSYEKRCFWVYAWLRFVFQHLRLWPKLLPRRFAAGGGSKGHLDNRQITFI